MKVWELEKNKKYTCNNTKFLIDDKGFLHFKKKLKRKGVESWCFCDLTFNTLKSMDFTELNISQESLT